MRLSVKNEHIESPQFNAEEASLRVRALAIPSIDFLLYAHQSFGQLKFPSLLGLPSSAQLILGVQLEFCRVAFLTAQKALRVTFLQEETRQIEGLQEHIAEASKRVKPSAKLHFEHGKLLADCC